MPELHTSGGPPKIIKSAVKGRASSRGVTLVWRNGTIGPRSLLPMVVVALGACVATSLFGELSAADRWVQTVAFSRDGRILVADVDHYLFVWEADSGELRCGADYSPRYTVMTVGSQMSLAPSGTRAGVDSYSLGATLIDTANCDRVVTLGASPSSAPLRTGGGPGAIAFSRDEKHVVAADAGDSHAGGPLLHLYDASTGERLRSFETDLSGDIRYMDASAVSPDGTRVAGGGGGKSAPGVYGGLVIVWDMASGRQLYHVTEPSPRVEEVGFSPGGERLMVRGADGGVRLWDAMRGGEPLVLRPECGPAEATAFLPRGATLLIGCGSGVVEACDVHDGNCKPTALPEIRGLSALAVHPDGERVAIAGASGSINIVELASGRRIQKIKTPRSVPDTGQYGPSPPATPPLEMFKTALLICGPVLWLVGLAFLFWWLRRNRTWLEPETSAVRRTTYIGLRSGTWLTTGGIIALVLALIPAGPWLIFLLLFPLAYATFPVFMLATALGLAIGAWKTRDDLTCHQLTITLSLVLTLILLATPMLLLALHWINEPK